MALAPLNKNRRVQGSKYRAQPGTDRAIYQYGNPGPKTSTVVGDPPLHFYLQKHQHFLQDPHGLMHFLWRVEKYFQIGGLSMSGTTYSSPGFHTLPGNWSQDSLMSSKNAMKRTGDLMILGLT